MKSETEVRKLLEDYMKKWNMTMKEWCDWTDSERATYMAFSVVLEDGETELW